MAKSGSFVYKVNDIPLRYKFLLIYVLCVLIPIMTINLFFFKQNSDNIRVREADNLRKSIDRAAVELQGMIDEGVAVSHALAGDQSLYETMDRNYANHIDYYDMYDSFLRNKLRRYMTAYPNILEVGVYTTNPTIDSGANYFRLDLTRGGPDWVKRLNTAEGGMVTYAFIDYTGMRPEKKISIISEMDSYPGLSNYRKVLRIDLNTSKFYDILNREIASLQLRLVDDQNRLVMTGTGVLDLNEPFVPYRPLSSKQGSAMEKEIGQANYIKGWKLIGIADTRRIDRLMADAGRSILLVALVSMVIPSLLIFVILRSYHYRVKKLSRHMGKVRQEKFDLIHLQEGRDEIGGLIRTYNTMTEKINALINDVYKLEIRQKNLELERIRAEMNMLQSQMNPHFLFNTLNALMVVCAKSGNRDAVTMIQNLSLLLRRMLSRSDDLVTLEEEIQFTERYLQIEQFRFGGNFDYVFDIGPGAAGCLIPKMSIQPLAENACKHGVQTIQGSGLITISAGLSDRGLTVSVSDNGVGMDGDRVARLLEDMRSDTAMDGHVGIRNIYRRLELFYHESVVFRVKSEPGAGTSVGFSVPLTRLDHPGQDAGGMQPPAETRAGA